MLQPLCFEALEPAMSLLMHWARWSRKIEGRIKHDVHARPKLVMYVRLGLATARKEEVYV